MDRVLTDRELTVSLLARQLLLERRRRPVAAAVSRLAALQAQYSPSPHVALHARLDGFRPADLERALRRGAVVKSTLMRGTLHVVAAADFPAFAAAWQRQWRPAIRTRSREVGDQEEAVVAELAAFAVQPRTTDALRDRVRELTAGAVRDEHLLDYARAMVPLVHVPPSGFWRQHGKFSLVAWAGPLPGEPAATALLVRRCLAAFGPATRDDVAMFTGLRHRQLDPALAALAPLRRFTDERGRELLDLPRAPLPAEDVATPTRFLPWWDAALISHRDRTRILPAALHDRVVESVNGTFRPTFLVDGQVAGVWSHRAEDGEDRLTITPLTQSALPADLEPEAERLLAFLAPEGTRRRVEIAPHYASSCRRIRSRSSANTTRS